MSIFRNKEEMFSLIRQWEESDDDRAIFCKEHKLSKATFSYWRNKYHRALKLEINGEIEEQKSIMPMPIEIVYPNGVIIRLPQLGSTSDLKALVSLD